LFLEKKRDIGQLQPILLVFRCACKIASKRDSQSSEKYGELHPSGDVL
jgi:hypothetical protein